MGIGIGIALIVIGLVIVLGAIEEWPEAIDNVIDIDTFGWICLVVGILSIVLGLVMNQQRSRTTHVEERREY